MSPVLVVALTALFMAAGALIVAGWQYRSGRRLARQLEQLKQQLADKGEATRPPASFSAHLSSAEQVQDKRDDKPIDRAEKYRYAVALAQQGYSAEGIAKALNMALTEVEQVMGLARIKRTS